MAIAIPLRSALEPILAQGLIEKAFPEGLQACTERVRFSKAESGREPLDGGFAMKRGLLTGAVAERELYQYASGNGFTIDLGRVVDEILTSNRLGQFPSDRLAELRTYILTSIRQYE